ncbi:MULTISPECIES: ATP-binding protein [Bacillaceae]|uniref:ATPase n=1 Tax=Evansella alkalicola TaxID=745819 RepID=A0ABS6JYI5_9BACI|nr:MULTISPECIES: SbcC/MukB-like Walker B domain-containing protein [Bacillaceae]MBU9723151.1 ATPase [Bacillus alkalicola]
MKWMKKLKLINWHYFKDEEIPFGRQTMITGRNAAGKSTIIDALQVLFIANLKMIRFNSSAHDDAKRSLISYLRGKIGSDDQRYVREGDFTTYLMAEFFDEKKFDYFVVGVVIDVYRDDTYDQEYFIINDCNLKDIEYVKETGQLKNRDEFHRYVNNLKKRSVQERTKEAYQKALLNRMGQVNHRFFSSFSKALSFKPIQNVRDFVYDYILDKKELQLDIMKENFEVHQRYKRELEDLSLRQGRLKEIKDTFTQYKKLLDIVEQQEYVIRQLKHDKQHEENVGLKNQLKGIADKVNELTDDKNLAVEQHEEAKHKKIDAFQKWQNNQEKKREEELHNKIKNTSEELQNNKEKLDQLVNHLHKEKNMIKDLIILPNNEYWKWQSDERSYLNEGIQLIDSIIDRLETLTAKTIYENDKHLNRFGEELSKLYNRFVISKSDTEKKIKELKDRRAELIKEIKDLENKKRIYPPSINKLKELLKRELNGKSNVWIFCEEMEILNEEWRNAIEGYLHTQKFDLLVEPDYFEQALSIYEKEKWNLNLEGVGLVNTNKERKYLGSLKQGSLAEVLETTNPVIQARTEHLLGRVMKAKSEKELSQHNAAITSSCMLYQNLVARQIKKERYQIPYIGSKAILKQLELKKEELRRTDQNIQEAEGLNDLFSKWVVLLTEKRSHYNRLNKDIEIPATIEILVETLEKLKIELSQLDLSGIKKLEEDYYYWKGREEKLEKRVRELIGDIKEKNIHFNSLKERLEHYETELEGLIQQLAEWRNEHSEEMFNLAEERLKEAEKQDLPLGKKIDNWINNQKGNRTQADNKFKDLRNHRHDYNVKHNFNGDEETTHNNEYQQLLEQIDIDIDSYQEKLKEALRQSEEEFKSHFIYKMKEAIEGAKRQFQQLNDALKRFPFHQENYQFDSRPSEKYKRFYEIIMDPQVVEKGSLFDIPDDAKDQSLHELFEILIKGEVGDQEEFSDYRRYLDFDIIITTTNSRIRFSQVLKEKSGGETQTPFYIAILSSFNQLYSSDKTMRLVVFDEAFNKMDEERIQTSLRLIKNMNFQLIAAVPDEKLSNMATEVSTIIVVHREGYECFTDMIDREVIGSEGIDERPRENQTVSEQNSLFASEEV